ncbi:MAG: peptide antibiotic transporter SbmA [Bauldia sp.]
MFKSFFPRPLLLAAAALAWTVIAVLIWVNFAADLGPQLGLGGLIGFPFPPELPDTATAAEKAARAAALVIPADIYSYQYMFLMGGLFALGWRLFNPHPWFRWSVVGSGIILFIIWFQVRIDVLINNWFGTFYDLIQKALGAPNSVTPEQLYAQLLTFISIAMVAITVAVVNRYLVSHYIFRWRTAMNDYYLSNWSRLRNIEGASQRIQEDTMRFAQTSEDLGVHFVDSILTLVAFLPILWGFSAQVKVLPIVGEVAQALVWVAVVWSIVGTGIVAIAGIRLPGLQFRNQRVEAAFRKELVLGEDYAERAQPPTVADLFRNVRRNYFRLYFNYLYFNVARYAYLQAGAIVPYVALAPTLAAGTITLGIMNQILRALGRVTASFQFLVSSWSTIVELMSIYKRLAAFEATLTDRPLGTIEIEVVRVG